jgi:hypothetical protein
MIARTIVDDIRFAMIQKEMKKTKPPMKILERDRRYSANGFVNLLTIEMELRDQPRIIRIIESAN